MWGSWYFPWFLLRDLLFMQMNITSLMVLMMLCASLPRMEKQSTSTRCPCGLAVKVNSGWGSEKFPWPIPKGPSKLPYIFL